MGHYRILNIIDDDGVELQIYTNVKNKITINVGPPGDDGYYSGCISLTAEDARELANELRELANEIGQANGSRMG